MGDAKAQTSQSTGAPIGRVLGGCALLNLEVRGLCHPRILEILHVHQYILVLFWRLLSNFVDEKILPSIFFMGKGVIWLSCPLTDQKQYENVHLPNGTGANEKPINVSTGSQHQGRLTLLDVVPTCHNRESAEIYQKSGESQTQFVSE